MLISFGGHKDIVRTRNTVRKYFGLSEVSFQGSLHNLLPSCISTGDGFELNISLSRYAH